ncbi:ATP-binding protein, partial [Bacteroides mediterraneensis]|uniref:ATP-binding protein n=1 Tax=Bacteroides mediterraneensis TaxID=1841856 RepID=UPI000A93B95C
MNRLYPVGIQNFEDLRSRGYIYVDKTSLLYNLVQTGKYYFLSRPRRFGKSLMISTLEAYFQGKKELFKGLAMESLEKDWTVHPVLHMDLNTEKYDTEASLENKLELTLKQWEAEYGYNPDEYSVATRFEGVIRRAAKKTGQKVVILIDEYDKPMLQAISKPELQTEFRNTLKAFYGALKSCDGSIYFAMLTGVTKFSKVSVFSDLNNLRDISMVNQYAEICGISEAELHQYFDEDIHVLADKLGLSFEQTCEQLRVNYDGYHFCYKSVGMYNPFSLLSTFANMQIGS